MQQPRPFFETEYKSRGELSGRPVPYDSEDLSTFGIEPGLYQKEEHPVVSLSSFSQQREAAERQEQAQQLRIKQYRNQGPKLGGQGMG